MAAAQYAWRTGKAFGLATGAPTYTSEGAFEGQRSVNVQYAPDGSVVAAALPDAVAVYSAQDANAGELVRKLPGAGVIDLAFSPRGTFLWTWSRPVKTEDGSGLVPNLILWEVKSGKKVAEFERKAQEPAFFQFSSNEAYCIRQVTNELQVFAPHQLAEGGAPTPLGKLRVEGLTSFALGPGEKPSLAAFVGEKKGKPASVRVFTLVSVLEGNKTPAPVSQKTFFKADKIQMKWNASGSALLFMTSTEVDKTGQSYYGENNLYMMTSRGEFDCRVGLEKEGPIHDFEWSPNGREFVVIYGYMPAKTVLFSYKVNVIADLGVAPRNFVAFNPQGRFLLLGGFGNLHGTVDVWDREKLSQGKIYSFEAPGSAACQWSPDGLFILTATLSPRLRVDNGVRIWHCTGKLVHVSPSEELYQASWRPSLPGTEPAFPSVIPDAPEPSPAAQSAQASKPAKAASSGKVYRPPGARATGADSGPTSLSSLMAASGLEDKAGYVPPSARGGAGRKTVPGAPPGAAPTPKKGKKGKKEDAAAPAPAAVAGAADASGSFNNSLEKRVRNLNKKLKAILELKERQATGEQLEANQLAKIAGEKEIRDELASL